MPDISSKVLYYGKNYSHEENVLDDEILISEIISEIISVQDSDYSDIPQTARLREAL